MWHKAIWKGYPMRLELTRVGLLVELANHYTTRGACVYACVHVHRSTRWQRRGQPEDREKGGHLPSELGVGDRRRSREQSVVYWHTTRPGCQNRKCTNVNNRCIRSRNIRIITLTVDGLDECNCDAHKKVLFTNPFARAGYDTRSIFKRSLTGLNSEFSFS